MYEFILYGYRVIYEFIHEFEINKFIMAYVMSLRFYVNSHICSNELLHEFPYKFYLGKFIMIKL